VFPVLAAQTPAANADVREEQHHEDDSEDDVKNHVAPILVEKESSCEVSSGFGQTSHPSGGS
jgi:hypothetical protein